MSNNLYTGRPEHIGLDDYIDVDINCRFPSSRRILYSMIKLDRRQTKHPALPFKYLMKSKHTSIAQEVICLIQYTHRQEDELDFWAIY